MATDELIGRVFVEQLKFKDDSWILKRIPPMCANCNKNKYYYIYKSYDFDPEIKIFIVASNYKITCPECGEEIELDPEEITLLKPFIAINRKYERGKISQDEHLNQWSKIINKLHRNSQQ